MTSAHRRYLTVDQGIVAGVINALVNAGFVWLTFRSMAVIPASGQPSMGGDLVATSFLLPFLTVLIATPLIRVQLRNGAIEPLESPRSHYPALRLLPSGTFWRALALGGLFLVTVGPLSVAGLALFGVTGWTFRHFLFFKSIFGAIFGAAVTPIIAMCVLADGATSSSAPPLVEPDAQASG